MKKVKKNKKLEADIQHTQKLETLGVLASGIAHDINNLLLTILGNADIVLYKLSSESPLYKLINNIKTASLRASGLTNQMLAYSGKGSFIVELIDLNKLVDEMANLLKVSISKNILLKFGFAENLPAIEADAAQIRQVVMNLITNASESIGENNGVIEIKTGVMKADTNSFLGKDLHNLGYTYIEISDTGCGMNEEIKGKMFNPYFTTKLTGRGLGLSVVHEIVHGHNGIIKIQSEPERGTNFTVFFPSSGKTLKTEDETDLIKNHAFASGSTVLIVDDEEDVREVTKTMLETMDFEVYTASSGREGVEFFRDNTGKIDIILMDMTMPNMNGEEVVRKMRKICAEVPIILSSGYSEHDVKKRFKAKDMAEFIQKPYQIKALINKIDIVMRNK